MTPRDAATLILLRNGREVLMGARDPRHVFMPHMYVFPGGRLDPEDLEIDVPRELKTDVVEAVGKSAPPHVARGLALAAIRETWEETGLVVGETIDGWQAAAAVPSSWAGYFAAGLAPPLTRLEYVARAITPEGAPRRFDARFFMIDACHAYGELKGNGELHDLAWYPIDDALRLPLGEITELVLLVLKHHLEGGESATAQLAEKSALYQRLNGSELIEHI